jgi:serine/threonine protein kinase/tetratricopeptide (TPR) repeat protein
MNTENKSGLACGKCGAALLGDEPLDGHCLACLLETALDQDEGPADATGFFDHYRVATQIDGTPLELGRGAMGITFKAFDTVLGSEVALKVIDARIAAHPEAKQRFLREARTAARLRHPNIASVFYYGTRKSDGQCFYAMELVEGETLETRLRHSGPLPPSLALEVITQAARGLLALEVNGLVHRDLKPANLMLVERPELTVKMIDFGLAKAAVTAESQSDFTHGGFVGTPSFASPEQFTNTSVVDVRSDLYSLGITLWEMLTGHTPFRGTPREVMHQHQHASLPFDLLEAVPQPAVVLLDALLEKDPGRRFQTPADLLNAIPTIKDAIDARRTITRQSLQKTPSTASRTVTSRPPWTTGPDKISVARLPVTGRDVFGREKDIAFLNDAWANQDVNIVTIVAWAGVGKSALVNHWLGQMVIEHYRSADLVFGWSFYRQGTSRGSYSADEFFDAALVWFGDPDPLIGTAWEKGERLAKLMSHRRTLLILDGLEPLQNPPGPQEGRVRGPGLQALLRELAAFNTGLCVITTRIPVADIEDHEQTSVLRHELEQLSSDAGAKLLRALDIKGQEAELRSASDEFSGHCLALTLLGSYLSDAYRGDIRRCKEVSEHLAHDVRQGTHARKVMESYQTWVGEGPELSILRMLGLFDRPADENAIGALLKPPAICGLTESLTDLSSSEWQMVLGKLRRARLLAGEDTQNPGDLDTHPLVREYFGEQLRTQRSEAWKECNKRLYHYYRALAPPLPNSFREMEPLFSAVVCGCNAGLFREVLDEVYIPRIQHGNAYFAANVLGARGPLLSVLVHFFERGRWGSLIETTVEEQRLTAEDQLFILMQAGLYLTATRGLGAPDARICYERAEPLCHSLGRPWLLCLTLRGQWRYSVSADKLSAALQIAERVYSLAQEQNDAALMIGAYHGLACTLFYLGDFEFGRQYARHGVQIWRSGGVQSHAEDVHTPVVACLCYLTLSEWHLGEIVTCQANMEEAISIAKELNDMNALAFALAWAAVLACFERNPAEVDRLASALIELSTRHNFVHWLATGTIHRGWARSASGDTAEGLPWIEQGIKDFRASGTVLARPYYLSLKAEALHLADRTLEALGAINEAEALAGRFDHRDFCAELHRLRGVFLAALGAEETKIEASLCEAIRIAREQKSISLERRAEATYAEYCRQKTNASGERGFRLPLW